MQDGRSRGAANAQSVLVAWRRRLAAMLVVAVAGCGGGGGGSSSPPPVVPPAAATLATLSPPSVVAGSVAFTLTVNGAGFVAGSTVSVAGAALGTVFVSATQLTATVPTPAVATAGSLVVQVTNPGSAASNALNFTVTAAPVALALTSISPQTLSVGSAAFTLTATGTGFTATSHVSFDGTILPTTFVSSTQLTAAAPALTGTGDLAVVIVDGARNSGALSFQVTPDGFPAVLSQSFAKPHVFGDRDSTIAAADSQGRFVAFQSTATNLVAGDLGNGIFSSVYLRDTCVGAPSTCVPSTQLVSLNPAGAQCVLPTPGLGSMNPQISGDGRFVVFFTDACFPGAPASVRQIALRDTCNTAGGPVASCVASTTLVSANASGQPSAAGLSAILQPAISRNGRYIAWSSNATDIVAGAGNGTFRQLYLRDRCETGSGPVAGCVARTILVSATASGAANYDAADQYPAVSDNGIVAFHTSASNLVANPALQAGIGGTVFRADCSNGVTLCTFSLVGLVPGSGTDTTGVLIFTQLPSISRDGRYIGFLAQGVDQTNSLVAVLPPNNLPRNVALPPAQAMLYDSCIGASGAIAACTPSFAYESVLDNGDIDTSLLIQAVLAPSLSDDGRFESFAVPYNLAPNYPGSGRSVYVRDTCHGTSAPAGCTPHTALVSVDALNVAAGSVGWSAISGDGHFVVFYSTARSPPTASGNLPAGQVIMVRTGF
jgi:hypothetical protein